MLYCEKKEGFCQTWPIGVVSFITQKVSEHGRGDKGSIRPPEKVILLVLK